MEEVEKAKGEVGERGAAAAPAPVPEREIDAAPIRELGACSAKEVVDGEPATSENDGSPGTMGGARRRWCGLTPIEGESRSSEASPLSTCLDRKQGSCFHFNNMAEGMVIEQETHGGRKGEC